MTRRPAELSEVADSARMPNVFPERAAETAQQADGFAEGGAATRRPAGTAVDSAVVEAAMRPAVMAAGLTEEDSAAAASAEMKECDLCGG